MGNSETPSDTGDFIWCHDCGRAYQYIDFHYIYVDVCRIYNVLLNTHLYSAGCFDPPLNYFAIVGAEWRCGDCKVGTVKKLPASK